MKLKVNLLKQGEMANIHFSSVLPCLFGGDSGSPVEPGVSAVCWPFFL